MEEEDPELSPSPSFSAVLQFPHRSLFRRLRLAGRSPPSPLPSRRDRNRNRNLQLARVSLEGRLVGDLEAATSARSVGGLAGTEEVAAWELFSPMQRVLLVAVAAAASVGRRSDREVARLRRSVEIRDELLLSMQQRLDGLCGPMKKHCRNDGNFSSADEKYVQEERLPPGEPECFFEGCDAHSVRVVAEDFSSFTKSSGGEKTSETEPASHEKLKTSNWNTTDQEERRMSDLSDIFSSATSCVDIQMSVLAEQQDLYNLRRECQEKDDTIKDLTATILESSVAESKRIVELEDMIKRKNLVITKLRKDLMFLEKQVIQLTRIRRPSFSTSNLKADKEQFPLMSYNILYDMSSSSQSSSDSDCSESTKKHHSQSDDVSALSLTLKENHESTTRSVIRSSMSKSSSLPKENSKARISESAMESKSKQVLSAGASRRIKKTRPSGFKKYTKKMGLE